MPYMYILECADGSYYTGSTWNLEQRLWEHQNGMGANYTTKHLPVKLVYCEDGERVEDAFRREKQIQGWSRQKKRALIASDSNALHRLAECRNESHCAGFGLLRLRSAQAAQPTGGCALPTQPTDAKTTQNDLASSNPQTYFNQPKNNPQNHSHPRSLSEVEGKESSE